MAENSQIEWTDATWNPWYGCLKVSPGCKFCYMYRDQKRYGRDPRQVTRSKTTFQAPLKWPEPKKVFTCSWSDFFIDEADDWRGDAWDVIRQTPHHTYQILTKRPQNVLERLPADWGDGWPNVWLGVSVEDQDHAAARIPILLRIPAAVRFLSCEPLLGPVDLTAEHGRIGDDGAWVLKQAYGAVRMLWACSECQGTRYRETDPQVVWCETCSGSGVGIDWVIVGGESGAGARRMNLDWARSIVDQCQAADVPVFMKQLGTGEKGYGPGYLHFDGELPLMVQDRKGGDPDEWPADLRIRQFPEAVPA